MLYHIILWKLKDSLSNEEKSKVKQNIKKELEALKGQIGGIEKIHVQIDSIETSNADLMLDSVFTDVAAYKGYQDHPAHIKVANTYVRPYVETRLCLDFEG
jgi:hypothetical protein